MARISSAMIGGVATTIEGQLVNSLVKVIAPEVTVTPKFFGPSALYVIWHLLVFAEVEV
jgi:hypothetical protein